MTQAQVEKGTKNVAKCKQTQIQFQHKSNNETYYQRCLALIPLRTQDNLATLHKVFKHKFSYLLNRLAKLLNHHG